MPENTPIADHAVEAERPAPFATLPEPLAADLSEEGAFLADVLLDVRDGAFAHVDPTVCDTAGRLLATLLGGHIPSGCSLLAFANSRMAAGAGSVSCLNHDGETIAELRWRPAARPSGSSTGTIEWVEVSPSWRRQGLATALLAYASLASQSMLVVAPPLPIDGASWYPAARARVAVARLGPDDLRSLTQAVLAAATANGNPPPIYSTDQAGLVMLAQQLLATFDPEARELLLSQAAARRRAVGSPSASMGTVRR